MKENLRSFFIKLFAISIAVIIIINLIFNILLGERLEKIDKIISLGDATVRSPEYEILNIEKNKEEYRKEKLYKQHNKCISNNYISNIYYKGRFRLEVF